jgi:hypothetical protein
VFLFSSISENTKGEVKVFGDKIFSQKSPGPEKNSILGADFRSNQGSEKEGGKVELLSGIKM